MNKNKGLQEGFSFSVMEVLGSKIQYNSNFGLGFVLVRSFDREFCENSSKNVSFTKKVSVR